MAEQHNPTRRHAHPGGSHQFHCHGPKCGKAFPHQPGAGLFCSPRCEKAHRAHVERTAGQLVARGFKRNAKAPNVFTKDGISITQEQVKQHGLKEILKLHASVAQI